VQSCCFYYYVPPLLSSGFGEIPAISQYLFVIKQYFLLIDREYPFVYNQTNVLLHVEKYPKDTRLMIPESGLFFMR
jgi:hypothetical protein